MVEFNTLPYAEKVYYVLTNIQVAASIIGIFSNLLVIIIFSRKRFHDLSFTFYAQSLSACYVLLAPDITKTNGK